MKCSISFGSLLFVKVHLYLLRGFQYTKDSTILISAPHKFYIGFRYVNPLTEDSIEQMEK